MGRMRLRKPIMEAVAMKCLEEGKLLNKREYDRSDNPPIRSTVILNNFGNWSRMVEIMKNEMPEWWEELNNLEDKKDPLEQLRSKSEESNDE
ncbi:MAG TPA: hypothetical protein VLB82_09380 [Thermodesulfobacteriota bacterium]|nr:hypothetical protein [Thermodesulfobacteriota bacterium]